MTAAQYDAIDLFAGPGGWDVAAASLGLRVIGVEFDSAACQTRRAAGHPTVEASVLDVDPLQYDGVPGLIASPPCQTFSAAGKGSGAAQLPLVVQAIKRLGVGEWPTEEIAATHDGRTVLVLEPMRWALLLRPRWIVLEQVPKVLPVWEAMAEALRAEGYSVATGCLQAEQYGVPQTRRRAVLVASLDREVSLPVPTHTKYAKGKPRQADGLLPWVSMADALDWPAGLVGFPRRLEQERGDGRSVDSRAVMLDGQAYRARDLRDTDQPAQVVTEKARSWQLHTPSMDRAYDATTPRTLDEPANTLVIGNAAASLTWQPTAANAGDDADSMAWTGSRPSPTIVGSFAPDVVAAPGYRTAGDGPRQNAKGSVRVTVQEAAALQSFPADYPWQGSRTKQYQQVGNAVPPMLALAVLQAVLP